jgi:hypothetical protein
VVRHGSGSLSFHTIKTEKEEMKYIKAVAWIGAIAMGGILVYGFTVGDFAGEGKELLSMPWGIVSMVDLYVGFFLFASWIIFREKSRFQAGVWVILMMVLGSFTASVYILIALYKSRGNWKRFLMGYRLEIE